MCAPTKAACDQTSSATIQFGSNRTPLLQIQTGSNSLRPLNGCEDADFPAKPFVPVTLQLTSASLGTFLFSTTMFLSSSCSSCSLASVVASALLSAAGLAASLNAAAQSLLLPTVVAKTWALYDPATGKMLASNEATERIIPASLTKFLTAYIICEALHDKRLHAEQMVNVSLNAYRLDKSSSKMFIDPKVPVSINDLLYGLIIQSGNDAAVQLAEASPAPKNPLRR
jgi:D-alanyl-D-alanine carboxypeptidase